MSDNNNDDSSRKRSRLAAAMGSLHLSRFARSGGRNTGGVININQRLVEAEAALETTRQELASLRNTADLNQQRVDNFEAYEAQLKGQISDLQNRLAALSNTSQTTSTSSTQGQGGNSNELYELLREHILSTSEEDIGEDLDINKCRDALALIEGRSKSMVQEIESLNDELKEVKGMFVKDMFGDDEEEEEDGDEEFEFGGDDDGFVAGGGAPAAGETKEDDAMDIEGAGIGDAAATVGRGGNIEGGTTGGGGRASSQSSNGGGTATTRGDTYTYDGEKFIEPKLFGLGTNSMTPEDLEYTRQHIQRQIGTTAERNSRKAALDNPKSREMAERIEAEMKEKFDRLEEFNVTRDTAKYAQPRGNPTSSKGITQEICMLCFMLMFTLNGVKMTMEMIKDGLTMCWPTGMYSSAKSMCQYTLGKMMKQIGAGGQGSVTLKDLGIRPLPTVVLHGPVTMIDPVSELEVGFNIRSSTTGAPNVNPNIRYLDLETGKIDGFDIELTVGEVDAILICEKKGHVDLIAEFNGLYGYPTVLVIAAGGQIKDEASRLAAAIHKKKPNVPIFTATDLNGGGLNIESSYEKHVNCIPLITPEVVEKCGVKYVGYVKPVTATKFQNSLPEMQKKYKERTGKDYGNPTKPVNIEELLSLMDGSHVGKFILRLVKNKLDEMTM